MIKIGFTGTREGMSQRQINILTSYLSIARGHMLRKGETHEFHHGDCVGADAEAHNIAVFFGLNIVIHPPISESQRAWCQGFRELKEEKHYLERDRNIVNACNVLIAAPKSDVEEIRSGTWATYRYARKVGKPITLLPR